MKKVWFIWTTFLFLLSCTGCETIVAPEKILLTNDSTLLWLTDRAGKKLWTIHRVTGKVLRKKTFASAINDILYDSKGRFWVICDGPSGALLELSTAKLSILSETRLGHSPSAILFNEKTETLWIPQRFNDELWEVHPVTKEIIARISVGREPVAVVSVCGGDYLLVVNNLPACASTIFPVATRVDVIDAAGKKVIKQILLANGATDARSITVSPDGKYAYVTHLVGRYQLPTSQVDRGWMSTNALAVINVDQLVLETTVLLDTPQRGAANPSTVKVSPDGQRIIVALSGSHELCMIDRIALHDRFEAIKRGEHVVPSTRKWEDIPNDAGFLYGIRDFIPTHGKGTRNVVIGHDGHIVATNYFTGEIVELDGKGQLIRSYSLGSSVTSTKNGLGEMYFHDATLCFQQWQSCASCHPNDARVDGLNWDLLNDGSGNPKNTKSLLLAHKTPPNMITGIRRNAETAVRSGLKFIHFADVAEEIPQAIDEYLKKLQPVVSPYLVNGHLSEAAKRGKVHFDKYCISCHAGPHHTDMKQYMVDWATPKDRVPMDVPTLVEIWRTAPYLYDGRSYTMREMIDIHGPKQEINAADMDDLTAYILSL